MALDERLRRELERAGRPADPSGVYEELIRRRERRRIARRVEAGALALAVFAATIGGFFALTRIFRETEEPPPIVAPSVSNGLIVFSLPLESGGEHLFGVAPDGSALRQLTPEGAGIYRSPDVSPDGSTVVVVHEIDGFEPGRSVLATVPIEGGSPTWLSEEPWIVLDPAWSPDGSRIAFAGSPPGPFGVYVLELETGDVQLVPGTDEIDVGDPTWSPDGTRIAFEATETNPERWDIYSVRLDGSDLVNLTNTPDESETWPAWSWENERIAFVRGGRAVAGLYTMAADGTDQVLVTDGLPDLASPAWSPDGSSLAFSADTGQVYAIRPDGTDLQAVAGALGEPAWQALHEGSTIPPFPMPTPSPDPSRQDIGLGFPVCNVTSVTGRFADADTQGTAYVATKASDTGGCPDATGAFNVVAVDFTQDGLADVSSGPIECQNGPCIAFAAPDVDADGQAEIAVVVDEGGPVAFELYRVVGNASSEPSVIPIQTLEEAGGLTRSLWVWSGRGWFEERSEAARAYCVAEPGGGIPSPGFVHWSATPLGDGYLVSESAYSFNEDGNLVFVTRRESNVPFGASNRLPPGGGDELCGVEVNDGLDES